VSDGGTVGFERRGAIAWLTFDRPSARNAMTFAMYEALEARCEEVDADPGIAALVLRGAGGRAFVSGTDIAQFSALETGEDGVAYEATVDRVVDRLERVAKPTIALLDGFAVGAGLVLAVVCDLRVCTPDARLGMPIARTLGNCLSMANQARLVALLGEARLKELVFTARLLDGEEARAWGLATELVAAEAVEARTATLAELVAGHAPITLRVTKEAVRRLREAGVPDGDDLVRAAYGSEDFHLAVEAFMSKGTPTWRNR